jgi:hypothetical protein
VAASYHIADEPRPGRLQAVAVNPFWPLLGLMLGGAWLAWPWFVLNSFAVGSPTRRRELALVAAALVGSLVLAAGLVVLANAQILQGTALKLAVVSLQLLKLGVAYLLYAAQARGFGLYEYYGGAVQNGAVGAVAGLLLDPYVTRAMSPWIWFMLG